MEQTIFIIIFLIVLVIIFKILFNDSENFSDMVSVSNGNDDIYINIGIDKYVPEYWSGCLSPYCKRRLWWYNKYTPLPWNNSTKYPKWIYPPYTYFTNYYRYLYY